MAEGVDGCLHPPCDPLSNLCRHREEGLGLWRGEDLDIAEVDDRGGRSVEVVNDLGRRSSDLRVVFWGLDARFEEVAHVLDYI